jgi:RimJ/RimL family protein N-acetyltransferase
MHDLKPEEFYIVGDMLRPFDYSLSIRAAIEGYNPARMLVDDLANPRTVLALTGEGTFLAGDDRDPTTIANLHLLFEQIFTGSFFPSAEWCITLSVYPPTWEYKLPELIPTHEPDRLLRYHYQCRQMEYDYYNYLLEGYSVHQIDRGLTDRYSGVLDEWLDVEGSWGTVDNFLAKGIGFWVLHNNQLVARCTADCAVGDQIEVGVATDPAHRRKGLAAAATAATVEWCLESGYTTVGWHCEHDNYGSWRTAEKVGFQREREYPAFFYIFDTTDNLAQLGWSCYKRGEYARTTEYYEQVFGSRKEHPDYYYICAAGAWGALQNPEKALEYLQLAAENGWAAYEYTCQEELFECLHGMPEWYEVLARINENAG